MAKRRKLGIPDVNHEDKKIAKEKQEIFLNRIYARDDNEEDEITITQVENKEENLETLEKIYISDPNRSVDRLKRGAVFYVSRDIDNNEFYNNTRILKKDDRPFVVISNSVNNRNSGVITMAPIVTREEQNRPYEVGFVDNKKIERVVAVNQLTSIPVEHINGYMYTLRDDIMDKVDKSLVIHLSLSRYISKLISQYIEEVTGVKLPTNLEISLDITSNEPVSIDDAKELFAVYNRGRIASNNSNTAPEVKLEKNKEDNNEFKRHIRCSRWKEDEARRYIEYFDSHTIHECVETFGLQKYSIYSLIKDLREKFEL